MSTIKIFALGGLNETGKSMYVVNVDDENIFVFDDYLYVHMLKVKSSKENANLFADKMVNEFKMV